MTWHLNKGFIYYYLLTYLYINPIQTGLFFASQAQGGGGGAPEALPL